MPVWKPKERHTCADCGVMEGAFHVEGCTHELCWRCGEQKRSCGCTGRVLPRVPFMIYPSFCARCGQAFPAVFWVSDSIWEAVAGPRRKGFCLCKACYTWIARTIKAAAKGREA